MSVSRPEQVEVLRGEKRKGEKWMTALIPFTTLVQALRWNEMEYDRR